MKNSHEQRTPEHHLPSVGNSHQTDKNPTRTLTESSSNHPSHSFLETRLLSHTPPLSLGIRLASCSKVSQTTMSISFARK